MEYDLEAQLKSMLEMRHRWLDLAAENKARLTPFLKPIKALLLLCDERIVTVNFWSEQIEITIKVTDMKTVEPYLEAFELICGAEFVRTVDETTYGQNRTFSMSKFPLKICADVTGNDASAACKAVQVGEKLVPVYELRCDGEEQTG